MLMLMTQLYLHFNRTEITSSVDQLERCVLDIGHWMSANRLKLNADKTELLFASSSCSCATLSGCYPALQLGAYIVVACSHGHKIQLLSKKDCYKVSLCENFQRQSCSYIIPLSNGP